MSAINVMGPEGDCPKCGRRDAWRQSSPRYRPSAEFPGENSYWVPVQKPERLEWPCRTCGYVVETPTMDQESK